MVWPRIKSGPLVHGMQPAPSAQETGNWERLRDACCACSSTWFSQSGCCRMNDDPVRTTDSGKERTCQQSTGRQDPNKLGIMDLVTLRSKHTRHLARFPPHLPCLTNLLVAEDSHSTLRPCKILQDSVGDVKADEPPTTMRLTR